jgi:hypothetical protein
LRRLRPAVLRNREQKRGSYSLWPR